MSDELGQNREGQMTVLTSEPMGSSSLAAESFADEISVGAEAPYDVSWGAAVGVPVEPADAAPDGPDADEARPRAGRKRAGTKRAGTKSAAGTKTGPADSITVATIARAWHALVDAVADAIDGRERLWALEAGAGTRTLFNLPEDAYIVGVDRDGQALRHNIRLDERVVADLATYQPWAAGFDLINCWYVLDGVPDPAPILDRFAGWTAAQGLVVLALPNLRSLRGLLARLRGEAKLRRVLTPAALRRRFAAHGFAPEFEAYFEDSAQIQLRRRLRVTRGRWKAIQAAVRILSCGLLDAARTDYIVVFRKAADVSPVVPSDGGSV